MGLFGKKKEKRASKNGNSIDINKLITIDNRSFLIDKLSIHENEVKLHVYTNGDLFLLFEDDIEELWKPMIEYVGFHEYDFWVNGIRLNIKKNYQRFHQPITSSKNLESLIKEGAVDWSNIGRQTLVYNYNSKTTNIESICLKKATNTRLIRIKESLKNIPVGANIDTKIPYDSNQGEKYIIFRKLVTREVALHSEVLSQMKKRNTMDDQKTIKMINDYHNLIAYIEAPIEIEEMLISIRSKFDNPGMGFGGRHSYAQLQKIMKGSEVQVKEFGLIPKELQCIDIRIGYLRIEEPTPITIHLI